MSNPALTEKQKAVLQLVDQAEINTRYPGLLENPFFSFLIKNLSPESVKQLAAGWDEAEAENPTPGESK
jgi:hypothetical protein